MMPIARPAPAALRTPARYVITPTASAQVAAIGQPVPVVYGRDYRRPLIPFATISGSRLILPCIWSIGPIDAVEAVYINDEPPPAGVIVRHHLGTPGQAVDAGLAAAISGFSDAYTGTHQGVPVAIAYTVLEIPAGAITGFPRVTAIVRGRKILDDRTGQTVYSTNPALWLADFLRSPIYGRASSVDGVAAAANACDELVSGEPRRGGGGLTIADERATEDWVETLRNYAGCYVIPQGDRISLVADRPAPPSATIPAARVVTGSLSLEWRPTEDTPTVVRVRYTDTTEIPWRTGEAVAYATGVISGATPWHEEQFDLTGAHSGTQALREATERLNAAALGGLRVTLTVLDDGIRYAAADVLDVQHPAFSGQIRLARNPVMVARGRYRLEGASYSGAIYSNLAEFTDLIPPPPTPRDDPQDPEIDGAVSGNDTYLRGQDGTVFSRIVVTLTPDNSPGFSHFEVRFRAAGTPDPWQDAQVTGNVAYLQPVVEGVEYEYQVRSISKLGAASGWVAGTHTVAAKDLPPPPLELLSATTDTETGVRTIAISYPSPPADLAGFRIEYSHAGGAYTPVIDGVTLRQIIETTKIPAGASVVRARAEDRTGNVSAWEYTTSSHFPAPIPAGIGAALDAAADAQAAASSAAALAQSAYNLADGSITSYYQPSAPVTADLGDLWIDTDDGNHLYRWDGTQWVDAQDDQIASAISAAASAQATADGKINTYYQASPPIAESVGDLWFDSDAGNHPYYWTGSFWLDMQDQTILQALTTANQAYNLADEKIQTYYQNDAPVSADVGDLWIDTNDSNKLYRWSGTAWQPAQDDRIANALVAAQDAQAAADGKVVTFYQGSPPTAEGLGDLWIETDNGNKLWRWNGSAWVDARDTTIAAAQATADAAQTTANTALTEANLAFKPPTINSGGPTNAAALTFDGDVARITWDRDPGAQRYRVQIWASGSQRRQRETADLHFEYSSEDARSDGGPWRTIEARIYSVSHAGAVSSGYRSVSMTNSAPAAASISVAATSNYVMITLNSVPSDRDLQGLLISASTSSGFTPESNVKLDMRAGAIVPVIPLPVLPGSTWYVRAAWYDGWGKTGLNWSSQATTTATLITTVQIDNNAITSAKIAAAAVTQTQIADGSVSTPKLVAGAVQAGNIAAGAVTADKVAANAISADKIAANAITAAKIAAGAVSADKISVAQLSALTANMGTLTAGRIQSANGWRFINPSAPAQENFIGGYSDAGVPFFVVRGDGSVYARGDIEAQSLKANTVMVNTIHVANQAITVLSSAYESTVGSVANTNGVWSQWHWIASVSHTTSGFNKLVIGQAQITTPSLEDEYQVAIGIDGEPSAGAAEWATKNIGIVMDTVTGGSGTNSYRLYVRFKNNGSIGSNVVAARDIFVFEGKR